MIFNWEQYTQLHSISEDIDVLRNQFAFQIDSSSNKTEKMVRGIRKPLNYRVKKKKIKKNGQVNSIEWGTGSRKVKMKEYTLSLPICQADGSFS